MRTTALTFLTLLSLSPLAFSGTVAESQADWHKKYKKQANAPDPARMLLNTDPEPDLTTGFTSLFNGNDLGDWEALGGKSTFEAKDGMIIGTCLPNSPSTYLSTKKADYSDFIFTCEMKWEVDTNSGVMFRARKKQSKGGVTVFGPQAEMEGVNNTRGWSGGVYGQDCGGYFYPLWLEEHAKARSALKKDAWNRLTIQAKGRTVKTWVNGVPATHWIGDGTYDKGFFGLQVHKGTKGTVLWRRLSIKEQ